MKNLFLLILGVFLSISSFSQHHRYERRDDDDRRDRYERWDRRDDHNRRQPRVVIVLPHRNHYDRHRRPVYVTIGNPFCDRCRHRHEKGRHRHRD